MPGLLIRNLPDELHRKLRERAAKNRRSMTKEALVLLEEALRKGDTQDTEPPTPYEGRFPISDDWITEAKQAGRS